jgi:hypothetical protein
MVLLERFGNAANGAGLVEAFDDLVVNLRRRKRFAGLAALGG